jgi:alpha-glucosidase
VPIPWEAAAPAYGFNTTGVTWLPQPTDWAAYAVDAQRGVAGSTYEMYRAALRMRRQRHLGRGSLSLEEGYGDGVVAFRNADTLVLTTVRDATAVVPDRMTVLLASGPLDGRVVPGDTTVWLAPPDASSSHV